MSNILEQANNIINNRSEEKERQYGPMGEGFERAAMIASGMSGKEWSAHDMFIAMIALKFSRQSYNFKEDNLLDAVAYLGAWQNYINEDPQDNVEQVKEADTEESFDPHWSMDLENTVPTASRVTGYDAQGKLLTDPTATSPYDNDEQIKSPSDILQKVFPGLGAK